MTFASIPVEERFWPKVDRSKGFFECWEWTAAKFKPGGYAMFQIDGRARYAHRVAYELMVGPIPDGLQVDHLCFNTACVNPAHLEPVTARVNTLRNHGPSAANAVKTHCIRGHALEGDNLFYKGTKRQCATCRRVEGQAYYYRRKADPETAGRTI